MGHDLTVLDLWDARYQNFADLNADIVDHVEAFKPEVLFAVPYSFEIWTETLSAVLNAGSIATVGWGTDDSWRYVQLSRFVAPYFHAWATTSRTAFSRLTELMPDRVQLSQWAADATFLRKPQPANDCSVGVSFVGTAYGSRPAIIDELRKRGISVNCFGHGWPAGPVSLDEMRRVVRESVITLNFSSDSVTGRRRYTSATQIKARVFEVPAMGGFLLSETTQDLEDYLSPGIHCDTFGDFDEAARKIKLYLRDSYRRDRVAASGHEHVAASHTYQQRFEALIPFAIEARDRHLEQLSRAPSWNVDRTSFDRALVAYRTGRPWRAAAAALKFVASLPFGSKRGPRAARRLAFEVSWRLAGLRTYSSRGLPGRLFFDVK